MLAIVTYCTFKVNILVMVSSDECLIISSGRSLKNIYELSQLGLQCMVSLDCLCMIYHQVLPSLIVNISELFSTVAVSIVIRLILYELLSAVVVISDYRPMFTPAVAVSSE